MLDGDKVRVQSEKVLHHTLFHPCACTPMQTGRPIAAPLRPRQQFQLIAHEWHDHLAVCLLTRLPQPLYRVNKAIPVEAGSIVMDVADRRKDEFACRRQHIPRAHNNHASTIPRRSASYSFCPNFCCRISCLPGSTHVAIVPIRCNRSTSTVTSWISSLR